MKSKAIVLLSGGIDSSTTLAVAVSRGYEVHALTVDYGQRNRCEIEAAVRIASFLKAANHKVIELDLAAFGGSALTDDIDVPDAIAERESERKIPVTYVPARNTILLALALAWAEVMDAANIFIGVNAVDYSGYPDCRPEFVTAFQALANVGTKKGVEGGGFRIEAPLQNMTKAEIIKLGISLGVDYSLTHSCYNPLAAGTACGRCDSCAIRLQGFAAAGIVDPAVYSSGDYPFTEKQ